MPDIRFGTSPNWKPSGGSRNEANLPRKHAETCHRGRVFNLAATNQPLNHHGAARVERAAPLPHSENDNHRKKPTDPRSARRSNQPNHSAICRLEGVAAFDGNHPLTRLSSRRRGQDRIRVRQESRRHPRQEALVYPERSEVPRILQGGELNPTLCCLRSGEKRAEKCRTHYRGIGEAA